MILINKVKIHKNAKPIHEIWVDESSIDENIVYIDFIHVYNDKERVTETQATITCKNMQKEDLPQLYKNLNYFNIEVECL